MRLIVENRASTILYNVILANELYKGKILLPANICPIVPATLFKANTKFEFYDIDDKNYLPNTKELLDKITTEKDISAILYNHTYGHEKNPEEEFYKIKSINENIFIINDACLTIPKITIKNTYADITLFSTGYSKYVDLGFGGYAFLKENVKYYKSELSYNETAHENLVLQFKQVLNTKTKFNYIDTDWLDARKIKFDKNDYLQKIIQEIPKVANHKEKLNIIYNNIINPKFHLGKEYNNWRFNIIVKNKDIVLEKIFENNLFASSHYQSLVNIFGIGNGKNAEKLHSKVINLFNDFRFDEEKALLVSEIVNKYGE